MTALLTTANWSSSHWIKALRAADPGRNYVLHGVDEYDPASVRYALTWKPPEGLLPSLPNLEVIFNLGAGVDAVLSDPDLPDVPLVRLVDENLADRMTEWVTWQVLTHHRQGPRLSRPAAQPAVARARAGHRGGRARRLPRLRRARPERGRHRARPRLQGQRLVALAQGSGRADLRRRGGVSPLPRADRHRRRAAAADRCDARDRRCPPHRCLGQGRRWVARC